MWRRLDHSESIAQDNAVVAILRFLLRLANAVLAAAGLVVFCFAVWMLVSWRHQVPAPPHDTDQPLVPWFIAATGGAGLFAFATAAAGLAGAARNSRLWLGLYTGMAVVLLICQGALGLVLIMDSSWQKRLPPDGTGEARRLQRWMQHHIAVCRWLGLGLLIAEVVGLAAAAAVSSAQARTLAGDSEDDEEYWGRRRPLLQAASMSAPREQAVTTGPDREDPWTQRMRTKYGLDANRIGS